MRHPFYNYKKKAGKNVGYNRKGYSFKKAMAYKMRTGHFKTTAGGSGHRAGEKWGDVKDIDPSSSQRRYSKNSPSFDEGVAVSKKKRMARKMGKVFHNPGSYENF